MTNDEFSNTYRSLLSALGSLLLALRSSLTAKRISNPPDRRAGIER
ncbi:MAG: hypothetical protein KKG06_05645 [Bacteroidetes bacterium]|nr:hypothetical protein [Bacteroidota bacterium]MBU1422654.1 hypothetical protein [Bacteroidota bacterium]